MDEPGANGRLKVEYLSVEDLVPYARNSKKHPAWQVDQIAASIEQFGDCDPVGIWHNSDGQPEIVEGHGRVLALKQLGIGRCPCISLDHLDDDARRAYSHVHNQTTLTSGLDASIVEEDIAQLGDFDWEDLGLGDFVLEPLDLEDKRQIEGSDRETVKCPKCGFMFGVDAG